jgi:signal transduction histidine kinase
VVDRPAARAGRRPWDVVRGRLGGVRVRAVVAATLVVALILAVAAVAFVLLQRRQLEATLGSVAEQDAAAVAAQVARDGAAAADVTPAGAGEQALVQVLDARGRVVAASSSVAGEPPLVDRRLAPGQTVTVRADALPIGEEDPFAVSVRGVRGPDGDAVVIAAQSLESAENATDVLVRLLTLGYPVLLVLVAGTSYWLTGRALAPVEAMRRRVAGITATDLDARVPVPPSHDQVAELAVTMNEMLDRLAAATEAQRRFVADASHELRSPLASIRAAHEVASVHPEAVDWAEVNADVLAELTRLERLVDDLLFLTRTDERGPRPQHDDVDLDDLVAEEASRLRRTTGLQVVTRLVPARVVGDRLELARVLRNLADNATRYAVDRVELRVEPSAAAAVVDVVDDGPGIPVAERDRVFDRFVRLDTSRERAAGGAGLGLAIAREIARAHGGDLVVLDTPRGAHLRLRVPQPADLGSPDSGRVQAPGGTLRS